MTPEQKQALQKHVQAMPAAGYAYASSITNTIKLNKESSIGFGSVESAVKQVDRRTKISGAQWKRENVPQVLAHRCAYLNGLLSV